MHNFRIQTWPSFVALLALSGQMMASFAAEKEQVFSGPQAGEQITPFQVTELIGPRAGQKRTIASPEQSGAVALVFIHQVERSMVPLMTVIDAYGDRKKSELRTEFIFLTDDPLAGQQRFPLVAQSLKLKAPFGISVDGGEGPGNYGLNKTCLLTLVCAKDHRVSANFGLVQPGIADAPKVIAALAKLIGDTNPPSAQELAPQRYAGENMRPPQRPQAGAATNKVTQPQNDIPGAAPTDAHLLGLLRRFIQRSNSPGDVDKVLGDVKEYIKDNPDLRRQAVDGWTRVLYLKYGTEYAQKTGVAFVQGLKK